MINFDIKYLYYRDGWDDYKTLKDGSVLYRERDNLKIIFTPSERAYVYIFLKGSSGNIYRLFPMKSFKGKTVGNFNPVQPGEDYHIPKPDKAFSLSGIDLENRYSQILHARSIQSQDALQIASRAFESETLDRDIGEIVPDPIYDLKRKKPTEVYDLSDNGKIFIVIRDRLLSCDGCVSTVTYELR
jgi:hypothetical protein